MFPGGPPPQPPANISSTGGEPRGAHLSRDGHGVLEDGGGNDDDDDDDEDLDAPSMPLTGDGKRKKKRKPRKKKKKATQTQPQTQSSPPRVPISDLFTSGVYPVGELQKYPENTNTARTTSEELRYRSRQNLEDPVFLNDYRKAAEVHRQVRHWVQETVKPGQTLNDVAVGIEDSVRALLGNDGLGPGDTLKSGMGFPTGLCLNNVVAHWTPNPGQKDVVLQQQDVMKVDYGVVCSVYSMSQCFETLSRS